MLMKEVRYADGDDNVHRIQTELCTRHFVEVQVKEPDALQPWQFLVKSVPENSTVFSGRNKPAIWWREAE